MDKHALAILEAAEAWKWSSTMRTEASGVAAITLKLLSGFIAQSQVLGGTLLDQFWLLFGSCHPRLNENSGSTYSHKDVIFYIDFSLQFKNWGEQTFPRRFKPWHCFLKQ